MNRGIYPPLAGALVLERRLEVLANNIGNLQTTGFKKDRPIFATVLAQTSGPSVAGIDLFPVLGGLPADRSQGTLAHSGAPLDVALQGEGFLVRCEVDARFEVEDRAIEDRCDRLIAQRRLEQVRHHV